MTESHKPVVDDMSNYPIPRDAEPNSLKQPGPRSTSNLSATTVVGVMVVLYELA